MAKLLYPKEARQKEKDEQAKNRLAKMNAIRNRIKKTKGFNER